MTTTRATPVTRSRDFWSTAARLVRRLAPQRNLSIAVIALGLAGTAIGVVVPRILGHATDLLFNGVIGRGLPAGITKAQAVAQARARGQTTFADLLSGMNVVPGRGVDFGAVAQTLAIALSMYLVAALLVWAQSRLLNVTLQRTMVALRNDVEDKVHRLPLSYFDGRLRGELLSRMTNDIDNVQSSLSMTISQLLTALLTVVAVLAMMLSISPPLTLITLLTVPLSLLATRAIGRRSHRLFVAQWTSIGRLNAHIEETYSGFTVVKTFGHRAAARTDSAPSTTTSTTQASDRSSSPAWWHRPRRSSATWATSRLRCSAGCRWRPDRSPSAAFRHSSSTSASSTRP